MLDPVQEQVDFKELIQLCAADSELFCRTFFSKAFRQATPQFARPFWSMLDDHTRLVNIQMFRGASKTTRLRAFTAKRIAYGVSRTILYIGKSEGHAVRSVEWIRQQVSFNSKFSSIFGLSKGGKWQGIEAQVAHSIEGVPISVLAMGITGSIRGILSGDFRPDLIVIDDPCDEENSATLEQRTKIEDLVFGALMESLAPATESPEAKLVMLQTPLNREDISTKAMKDPAFRSLKIGCWTPETEDLPLDQRISVWPERWPSETLRQEKLDAARRNKLSLFTREKECKIVSAETTAFRPEWLKRWDVLPPMLTHVLAIDPVPPPSDLQVAKGFADKDYEAVGVVGTYGGKFYVREISMNRGHDPSWTCIEAMRLAMKYRVTRWVLEAIAYQRTLKWIFEQYMRRERRYFRVDAIADTRSKYSRIVDSHNGPASNGVLYIPPDDSATGASNSEGMAAYVEQFQEYPGSSHDDALDMVAAAIANLTGLATSEDESLGPEEDDEEGPSRKLLERNLEHLCP